MCRADQVSIKKGLGLGEKLRDEFIPRWIKRELQKQKPSCCVPGCGKVADRTCVFASFDSICAAVSVNSDKSTTFATTSPFPLCTQHYHTVYKHSVTLKVFMSVHCVVVNVGTVPTVTCAGHSDLSPSLSVLIFCCGRQGILMDV